MGTKESILMLFESDKGRYISGEEIAEKLGISRTSVWKAVKKLRSEGYDIDSVTNKGYCLSEETDMISAQGIYRYLGDKYGDIDIHVLPVTESTNTYVRKKAEEGAEDGYTLIANEQTCGRGRSGRSFFSPGQTGVYMSILLRPEMFSSDQALMMTTMAAVAVCEAIEEVSDKKPGIKWVNDIMIDGKKVCGILTEASFSLEGGMLEYAVLGIGINTYRPEKGFPADIKERAGYIYEKGGRDRKNRLIASFLDHFMYYYHSDKNEHSERYRNYSILEGKEIIIMCGGNEKRAKVSGISDDCRLCVEYEDGSSEKLSYGEIHIVNQ